MQIRRKSGPGAVTGHSETETESVRIRKNVKEKPCISAGILKLMARFKLATSSLPNGAEMFISSPKTEQKTQKIDIKWRFRVEFWKIMKDAKNMQIGTMLTQS